MAATVRRRQAVFLAALLVLAGSPLYADRPGDVRAQVTYVASALASGNPTDALGPFDKSCADYDKLSQYFAALTGSFEVVSEIEIADEDDADQETTLKVSWALQVSGRSDNPGSRGNQRRTYDVTMRLKAIQGKWKIVSFAPVEMFNPQSPAAANK